MTLGMRSDCGRCAAYARRVVVLEPTAARTREQLAPKQAEFELARRDAHRGDLHLPHETAEGERLDTRLF